MQENEIITEQQVDGWDGDGPLHNSEPVAHDDALIVDVGGFEGPLDLLLELARRHKIDLVQISILDLADQYLAYMERARALRLELAADYLVMAAWLAYLKSRLLLPRAADEDKPAEELGAQLAFRLQRLLAMREAVAKLLARNLLGRDVFARGAPEPLAAEVRHQYGDNLIDLLKAYASRRQAGLKQKYYAPKRLPTFSIKEARLSLERLVGSFPDWTDFDGFLLQYFDQPGLQRTVRASSFTASLELAREGRIEIRQQQAFAPIFFRHRKGFGVMAVGGDEK